MTVEEKRLYSQYFYNCVIEFVCFVISYLTVYKAVSLSNLYLHVKFFKTEVNTLISSFEGKSEEDKLHRFLKILDCFVVSENEVRITECTSFKDGIYEELLLSRSVDLILKGLNDVTDVCKNLNADGFIKVEKHNLLNIFEKHSLISVNKINTVSLHHAHGLLGFEDHLYNAITGYFYDILYHGKILSYDEVISHSTSLSFCGINNVLGIFSILISSQQFICQDGYVLLRKKRKKYQKKKPLHMEKLGASFSSRSLPVGQIVYSTFGDALHQWRGEISTLSTSLGVICCVVDFTNGHRGVFNIYFSKAALKSIAGIDDLRKYMKVRDAVEFDAEHYTGKSLDRCWKATRVKLLSSKKIQYDESLCAKLNESTNLQRNKCKNYLCCNSMNCIVNSPPKSGRSLLLKNISNNDSSSLNSSHKSILQEVSSSAIACITNTQTPDYLFVFGRVSLLMQDKGIIDAIHDNKWYSILFLKESVYHPNKPKQFVNKGQKVLAFIPYVGKLETFCVATLVYSLSEKEVDEISDILPQDFVVKTFLWNALKDVCCRFCRDCKFLNGSQTVKMESLGRDLKYKIQLTESYESVIKQCKVPLAYENLQLLLHSVCKSKFTYESSSVRMFHFFTKLAKYLHKGASRVKSRRRMKCFYSEDDTPIQGLSSIIFRPKSKSADSVVCKSRLSDRSRSCDLKGSSFGSLNSYKSCSTGSSEVFYSCDSARCSPSIRSSTPNYLNNSKEEANEDLNNSKEETHEDLNNSKEETNEDLDSKLSSTVVYSESKTPLTSSSLETMNEFSKPDFKESSPTDMCYEDLNKRNEVPDCELSSTIVRSESKTAITSSSLETMNALSKLDSKESSLTETCYENLNKRNEVPELEPAPLPTVLNDECKILSIRYCQETKGNAGQFSKRDLKASKCYGYFPLQSVPCLKPKKKKMATFSFALKPGCENCSRSCLETSGSLSLISTSSLFFSTSIDGVDVLLPLPKNDVPKELQEKMKIGSQAKLTVVPSVVLNLSHIMKIDVVI